MRTLVWLVRAAIFFTLFAFALNNQQEAGVRWFFGQEWRAPMVFIVLTAFALGCALGDGAELVAPPPRGTPARAGDCRRDRAPGFERRAGCRAPAPAPRWALTCSGFCSVCR